MTPMYQSYLDVKKEYGNKILFYQLGDFFEVFGDDARRVSEMLDLTLTARNIGEAEKLPMCGVPKHTVMNYVNKITETGEDVVVCQREKNVNSITVLSGERPAQNSRDVDTPQGDNPAENGSQEKVVAEGKQSNELGLSDEAQKILNDLPRPRKELAEKVIAQLEKGQSFWQQGWVNAKPQNAISKKQYHGVNEFILTLDRLFNERQDPRYLTFNQAKDHEWKVKKGASGLPIEFFKIINKDTKKEVRYEDYIKATEGMSAEDAKQWQRDHLQTIHRYSIVFSAEDVEGIPEYESKQLSLSEIAHKNESLEKLMNNWCCDISHSGGDAYYDIKSDKIQLPFKESFESEYDLYSTALHEMAHSTGHESRLHRFDVGVKFASKEYAKEELRAEIASMFMCNAYDLPSSEQHIENHSAYIKHWNDVIKENPKELFLAIKDAGAITNFVDDYAKEHGIDFAEPTYTDVQEEKAQLSTKEKQTWETVNVNESDFVKKCKNATLFAMPNGSEYEGYQFFHPNKLVHMKESDSNITFDLSYTKDFVFNLTKGEEKVSINAETFSSQIETFGCRIGELKAAQIVLDSTIKLINREMGAVSEQWIDKKVDELGHELNGLTNMIDKQIDKYGFQVYNVTEYEHVPKYVNEATQNIYNSLSDNCGWTHEKISDGIMRNFSVEDKEFLKVWEKSANKQEYLEPIEKYQAKIELAKATSKLINKEMSYVDARWADTKSDELSSQRSFFGEIVDWQIEKNGVTLDKTKVSEFIAELVDEYAKDTNCGISSEYGWTKGSIKDGIMRHVGEEYKQSAKINIFSKSMKGMCL